MDFFNGKLGKVYWITNLVSATINIVFSIGIIGYTIVFIFKRAGNDDNDTKSGQFFASLLIVYYGQIYY